jgi:hypothetical protein
VQAHPAVPAASRFALAMLGRADRVTVRGAAGGMVHLDTGRGIVTLTAPGVPLMANAVAVDAAARVPARPARWDPRIPPLAEGRERVAALADALGTLPGPDPGVLAAALAGRVAVGDSPRGRAGLASLVDALVLGAPERARDASDALLGLGPGLTPEGDDLLVAAAVVVHVLGGATGLAPARRRRLAAALCPAAAGRRTTALSATLLRLAQAGAGPEPLARMLHGDPAAPGELARLGRTSGRALVAGAATSIAALLAA